MSRNNYYHYIFICFIIFHGCGVSQVEHLKNDEKCTVIKYSDFYGDPEYLESSILTVPKFEAFAISKHLQDILFYKQLPLENSIKYYRLIQNFDKKWSVYVNGRTIKLSKKEFDEILVLISKVPFGNFEVQNSGFPESITHFQFKKIGKLYMTMLDPDSGCNKYNTN